MTTKKKADEAATNEAASVEKVERSPLTLGEYRVGVSFNPSQSPVVDELKACAARLIDLIDDIATDIALNEAEHTAVNHERARLKAIAITHVETAAMYAVKAATKA
jgi:hypothetical protein